MSEPKVPNPPPVKSETAAGEPEPQKSEEKPTAASPPAADSAAGEPPETLASASVSSAAPAGTGDGRTFSQLLAGAMASPTAGSPREAAVLAAMPVEGGGGVHVPVVAVPCFLAPAAILEAPQFAGQFSMTHQAVLATVTAQAQMQLQAAYPSSSEALASSFAQTSPISPRPLQQKSAPVPEGSISTPRPVQHPSSNQKSQSTQIVVKTSSSDGYNWRKYGQKQVKSSDRSRSYYKCTNVNCSAKKKVERCPDGRETEIIYRGQHNHDPPQKTRCSKEKGVQSGVPSAENETLELPHVDVNESDPSTSKTEQNSGNETPERQLFCSSDCEGDAAVKTEEEQTDEPEPKRRLIETPSNTPYSAPVLKMIKEPKVVVQNASDAASFNDGFRWRKYGQKLVKGNPNPRSYYRCTHNGCPVRKHVERASDDSKAILITYEGKHNHEQPTLKPGSDQPVTTALIATATAVSGTTKDEQSSASDSLADKEPPSNPELSGDKTLELGGEKALESAQTLLSIGLHPSTGEEAKETNPDGMTRPLFTENCAAVPVQNS